MSKYLLLFCTLFSLTLSAQSFDRADFSVMRDGEELTNPWAGGLDNPQISVADFNFDGLSDLYIFDRVGEVHLTFIQEDGKYVYAPDFAENFPNTARNFVLLRDFNDDGIADIFAHGKSGSSNDGLVVWTGVNNGGKLDFERFDTGFTMDLVSVPVGSTETNLYVASTDIPDINDIDGDGDLDVLAFDVNGDKLKYYQNQSVETGYGADSLIFIREDQCWGKFYEASMAEEISLSPDPDICANGFTGDIAEDRHAGSTTVTVDLNNDGARELIIGDLINSYIFMLTNGGTSENAWMTAQDNTFPSNSEPLFIPDFNAGYIEDVNFDGKIDFIGAANAGNSPNYEAAWLYTNAGTNENPVFELETKSFMTETMLDFGSGSHPTFADVNGDGLPDLVVGSSGFNVDFGTRDARLFLYLNTGTATEPVFTAADDNWLNFTQYALEAPAANATWGFAPTFGDMDGDGDLDLVVGNFVGSLFYAENIGGAGSAMDFPVITFQWKNIDVGSDSAPAIADLNRDGLPDLVIGERNGNLNFLPNIGTATEPDFVEDENAAPNLVFLGEVNTNAEGSTANIGYSTPYLYDFNGDWVLYVGSRSRGVMVYDNIDPNNLEAPFNLVTDDFSTYDEGIRTHPALFDITNNDRLEMFVGNFRGGISAYETNISTPVSEVPAFSENIMLYPNPVRTTLRVLTQNAVVGRRYEIYNAVGQTVKSGYAANQDNYLSVNDLQAGVYFLRVGESAVKFVKE